jgi:hypothetical protein
MEVKLAAGEPFDNEHDAGAGWTAQAGRLGTLFLKWVISLRRDQGRLDDQAGYSLRCSTVLIAMVFRASQCIDRNGYD